MPDTRADPALPLHSRRQKRPRSSTPSHPRPRNLAARASIALILTRITEALSPRTV